jgi:hypothetical protein
VFEMANTTYIDVISSFQALPQSKYVLADGLVKQWFLDALGEYELEIDVLPYDSVLETFDSNIGQYKVKTIALIMYTYYLTRELSRVEKLSGISGKDISITGGDESKRTTYNDLKFEMERVNDLLNKQKQHCFS